MIVFWSGGKDCTVALHEVTTSERYRGRFRISGLLTTLTEDYDRISGHGVRSSVLDLQAACIGIKVRKTYITRTSSMEQYEHIIDSALSEEKGQGAKAVATGDIFIEKRRMANFKNAGLLGCFPLLGKSPAEHMKDVIDRGFTAYVICVDASVLDQSFVGCTVNQEFLSRLPSDVDLCGENGEYHTFVVNGPCFREPVPCTRGEIVFREGFYYCDLIPSLI
jgi:uncharacterized protein (TIGR00290 family)